jgi:GNAT superfamily N-acetyltransferase
MALDHRLADASDYPTYARLFADLGTGDKVPSPEIWRAEIAPDTWLFEQSGKPAGFLYHQRLAGVAYVRQLVVTPELRGHGVGRQMMDALADDLRRAGITRWCLNVKPDNAAAIRLYEGVGMHEAYRSVALRFPWSLIHELTLPDRPVRTCPIDPAEDAAIEQAFHMPRGQLAVRRAHGRVVLRRLHDPAAPTSLGLGFAAFDPDFPGAFPFRVSAPYLAQPLLDGLRAHARPDIPFIQLVVEDDDHLATLFVEHGAEVRIELAHYKGHVPARTS